MLLVHFQTVLSVCSHILWSTCWQVLEREPHITFRFTSLVSKSARFGNFYWRAKEDGKGDAASVQPFHPFFLFHIRCHRFWPLLISVKGTPFFTWYVIMATALNAADVKLYVFHLSCHTAVWAPFLWKRSGHSWATENGRNQDFIYI